MYLEKILESSDKTPEGIISDLGAKISHASFLTDVCIANEGADVPPTQIGNGAVTPDIVARENLKQTWNSVIKKANEAISSFKGFQENFIKESIANHLELVKEDQEYVKNHSEVITRLDGEFPKNVLIHFNPYILQMKSKKLDFSLIANALVLDYFVPKLELIQKGKLKENAMQNWKDLFYKIGSKNEMKPDTAETDFPVDEKLWIESRELFGMEGKEAYRNTTASFSTFCEKVERYASAASSNLTVQLVNATTTGGSKNMATLNSAGAALKRYVVLINECQEALKMCVKLIEDKYAFVRKVVMASVDSIANTTPTPENVIASEMAALRF